MKPTRERVLELLRYDRDTGLFTWAVDRTCGHGRVVARAEIVAEGTWPANLPKWEGGKR